MTGPTHQLPATLRDEGAIGLLAAIIGTDPPRPEAACRGQWDLFDRARAGRLNGGKHPHPDAVYAAASVCDTCPHATSCAWRVHRTDIEPRRALRGTQRP